MKKICVVTGTRAEYGLLQGVMQLIQESPKLELQVIATAMHLSPEFGLTYKSIESDGFKIDYKLETLLSSDTAVGVAKSIGLGVISFSEALNQLSPDMVVVLGDRFEIMAATQAAMVLQIPVAHIGGGDTGSGTYDNIIRHCLTKMSSLHFVTHQEAFERVCQLGEMESRVFCAGSTGVDTILNTPMMGLKELEESLGIEFCGDIFSVTFHPLTMDAGIAQSQLSNLLDALDLLIEKRECTIVFTKANADNGGRILNQMVGEYVSTRPSCHLFDSLGHLRFLSLTKHASLVIGNSSSGIYEAPYLKTPTIDIGTRQEGRAAPSSVLRCDIDTTAIVDAIESGLDFDFTNVEMIYGDGNAASQIVQKIEEFSDFDNLELKNFVDRKC